MRSTRWSRPVVVLWALAVIPAVIHLGYENGIVSNLAYFGASLPPIVAWIGTARAPRGARWVPGLIAAGLTLLPLGYLAWKVTHQVPARCPTCPSPTPSTSVGTSRSRPRC